MYDNDVLKKGNKIQAKDKIEPQHIQQTQLEPPDKNWPITSHIKDKGISAITFLACSIANKKQGHLFIIQFSIYSPGWILIYSVKILTNVSFRKYSYFPIEVSIQNPLEIPVFLIKEKNYPTSFLHKCCLKLKYGFSPAVPHQTAIAPVVIPAFLHVAGQGL